MIKRYRYLSIIVLTALFCLFIMYLFPLNQAELNSVSGEEVKSLDSRLSYSFVDVKSVFDTMGEQGRDIYFYITSVIDMIYPVVYGVLFMLILGTVLLNRRSLLRFMPFITVVFDYAENINTLTLLNRYPEITEAMVQRGSLFTMLKWCGVLLTLGTVVVFVIIRIVRRVKR
ncbi:MAG: hypothetical protein N4A72_07945 [Bacteroidales bacterium]|nr:hypothetical protein [Bacteroidales bacterium]